MNFYDLLEIKSDATAAEVNAAYRKQARLTHPDMGGSANLFTLVTTAHECLSDPDSRAAYDRSLKTGNDWNQGEAQYDSPAPDPEPEQTWGEETYVDIEDKAPDPVPQSKPHVHLPVFPRPELEQTVPPTAMSKERRRRFRIALIAAISLSVVLGLRAFFLTAVSVDNLPPAYMLFLFIPLAALRGTRQSNAWTIPALAVALLIAFFTALAQGNFNVWLVVMPLVAVGEIGRTMRRDTVHIQDYQRLVGTWNEMLHIATGLFVSLIFVESVSWSGHGTSYVTAWCPNTANPALSRREQKKLVGNRVSVGTWVAVDGATGRVIRACGRQAAENWHGAEAMVNAQH